MNCLICKTGELGLGVATSHLTRGETVVVLKGVPAQICDNCGEPYYSEDIAGRMLAIAEAAVVRGVEFSMMQFEAAARHETRRLPHRLGVSH